MEMNPKNSEKNQIPVPSHVPGNHFLHDDWNTLHRSKRKKSNSRASLSASYAARPSRAHLTTDSVRVKFSSLSATVSPVARLAGSPVLTVALVGQLDKVGAQTA